MRSPYGLPRAVLRVSEMLDAGRTQDARLEQLARLKAERFWSDRTDEDWGSSATFMMRPRGRYAYLVFPVWRARYHAVVRLERAEVVDRAPKSSDFEVLAVSILEQDAMRIAGDQIAAEP